MDSELKLYQSETQADQTLAGLSTQLKIQMAKVYQAAFGGMPWKERYICARCGRYLETTYCKVCQTTTTKEAYPVQELVENYFPKMLTTFVPGMLGLAFEANELVGFTTGGFIDLEKLIYNKYQSENPQQILKSITNSQNIDLVSQVFYDNETCILPMVQKQGLGKSLSLLRINAAISLNAQVICGRTINLPWLKLKKKQFSDKDFKFSYFVPEGDRYQVDNNPRYFYLAIKQAPK